MNIRSFGKSIMNAVGVSKKFNAPLLDVVRYSVRCRFRAHRVFVLPAVP